MRRFLVSMLVILVIGGPAVADEEDQRLAAELREEIGALRAELEQRQAAIESWQVDFEQRVRVRGAEAFDRLSDLEGTNRELQRQLEIRVPSYEALPDSSETELAEGLSLSERLENLIIFHGYLRSGYGGNGKGGPQEVFQAPGAPAKYRLGNENDTYGEIIFDKDWSPDRSRPQFRGEVMIAFQTLQNNTFDAANDVFVLRESFVEAKNFDVAPDWVFWTGQRYYDRHDIHINDFFFLDMSGYGGGIREIGMPVGTLDVAYLGGTLDAITTDRGDLTGHHLDLRWQDLPAPCGEAILWVDLAVRPGGAQTAGPDIETSRGYAVGVIHIAENVLGGFNKLAVLWGRDASANFSTSIADPATAADATAQLLVTETLTIQPSDWFTMQGTFIWRSIENRDLNASRVIWTSAGVRPMLHMTEHWAIVIEYGADHVANQPLAVDGTVQKWTIASELRAGNQFFSRPSLRAFFTYADWPDELRGLVGGDAYALNTHGASAGCQLETWW